MRWLGLVLVSPLLIGLGCGGNVETNFGGSGGTSTETYPPGGAGGATGGAGGATVTTSSSTSSSSSSSTSSTSTSSTSTGGGTACDQACAKAGDCGLPQNLCSQYVDCAQPAGQCAADCINDPAIMCSDIFDAVQSQSGPLFDCVAGCQGGGGAGGGSAQACQTCGQNGCQNAFFQCAQQSSFQDCQAWLQCAQGCQDQACLDACTQMHPAAQVISDCLCTTCAADCSLVCP